MHIVKQLLEAGTPFSFDGIQIVIQGSLHQNSDQAIAAYLRSNKYRGLGLDDRLKNNLEKQTNILKNDFLRQFRDLISAHWWFNTYDTVAMGIKPSPKVTNKYDAIQTMDLWLHGKCGSVFRLWEANSGNNINIFCRPDRNMK